MRAIALSFVVCALACDHESGMEPDAGLDAGLVVQGSLARGDLVINEVAPRPASGPDWIEVANRSEQAIDRCDYFVTDDLDRLDHYLPLGGVAPPEPCEPSLVQPGQYLVIYADDAVELGPDHAPFRLGLADQVHVVTRDGLASDSLIYLHRGDRASLARVPDSQGPFYPAEPSQGAANLESLAEVR